MESVIRFIADMHLYDSYSMDWRTISLSDYAELLVSNWNRVVEPKDTVIIVGDIGHECPKTIETLQRLNGVKVLVRGNHDMTWKLTTLVNCGVFAGIHDFVRLGGLEVEHIPNEDMIHKPYYIHGHHHYYNTPGMKQKLQLYQQDLYRLNCASDLINNTPSTLNELILHKELLLERLQEEN